MIFFSGFNNQDQISSLWTNICHVGFFSFGLRYLVSINFGNILFRCSRALTNPGKSLGQSSTLIAIILAGSLLIWFVLYDFNVSFKAQKCSWCFYLHRLLAHISRKCFYVYIITDIHSDFCMDVNFANLWFCCYDIKAIFRNFSTHSWWKSLSYRNQTIDLICKSVTGFYMIGISIMTELNVSISLFCASLYEILRVLVLKTLSF